MALTCEYCKKPFKDEGEVRVTRKWTFNIRPIFAHQECFEKNKKVLSLFGSLPLKLGIIIYSALLIVILLPFVAIALGTIMTNAVLPPGFEPVNEFRGTLNLFIISVIGFIYFGNYLRHIIKAKKSFS